MPLFAVSDVVWQALIAAVLTLLLEWRARQARDAARRVQADVSEVKTDIRKVEVATNSMKDALVETTEREALARGKLRGGEEERARQRDDLDK